MSATKTGVGLGGAAEPQRTTQPPEVVERAALSGAAVDSRWIAQAMRPLRHFISRSSIHYRVSSSQTRRPSSRAVARHNDGSGGGRGRLGVPVVPISKVPEWQPSGTAQRVDPLWTRPRRFVLNQAHICRDPARMCLVILESLDSERRFGSCRSLSLVHGDIMLPPKK